MSISAALYYFLKGVLFLYKYTKITKPDSCDSYHTISANKAYTAVSFV